MRHCTVYYDRLEHILSTPTPLAAEPQSERGPFLCGAAPGTADARLFEHMIHVFSAHSDCEELKGRLVERRAIMKAFLLIACTYFTIEELTHDAKVCMVGYMDGWLVGCIHFMYGCMYCCMHVWLYVLLIPSLPVAVAVSAAPQRYSECPAARSAPESGQCGEREADRAGGPGLQQPMYTHTNTDKGLSLGPPARLPAPSIAIVASPRGGGCSVSGTGTEAGTEAGGGGAHQWGGVPGRNGDALHMLRGAVRHR